jgi:hypothetical protein
MFATLSDMFSGEKNLPRFSRTVAQQHPLTAPIRPDCCETQVRKLTAFLESERAVYPPIDGTMLTTIAAMVASVMLCVRMKS